MRKFLPLFLFAGIAFPVLGQNYDYSVFRTKTSGTANAETQIAKVKELFPGWGTMADKLTGNPTDMYGTAMAVQGSNYVEKSNYCISNKLKEFGINKNEWNVTKETVSPNAHFVHYQQTGNGRKVVFAKMDFRFTNGGKLQRITMRNYGSPVSAVSVAQADDAKAVEAFTTGIPGVMIKDKKIDADWVWFPVPGKTSYELRPAWHIHLKATAKGTKAPLELDGYIDADNYKLLYRTNGIKDAFGVTVKGSVYKKDILTPATQEPLPNLDVQSGFTTYNTDNSGVLSLSAVTSLSANYKLSGLWANVVDFSTSTTPTFSQSLSGTGNTFIVTAPARFNSAYYHVNVVHDFMKGFFPTFTQLDFPMDVNVDDNTGTCNAFFNPSNGSLNFFAAGGGCNSLAETPDVIYHEYGHAISEAFYFDQSGNPITNSALNEANSDVWGMSITKVPINGKGALDFSTVPGGGCFRRYDKLPKMYPDDIISEPHGDGEIIAGAWWDVAVNLGSVPDMTKLFTLTYFDLPDGPDGTEGQVYHDVLIGALMNDDMDGDITNGTPHFSQIVRAFARHGIYLLGEVNLDHKELRNQKSYDPINVSVSVLVQNSSFFKGANLYYKVRGTSSWNTVNLVNTSGFNYSGQIPGQSPGTIVDYYFGATTLLSENNGTSPLGFDPTALTNGVTLPYQFGVGLVGVDSNRFENATNGWTIGNVPGDDATTGVWVKAVPIGSFTTGGNISQPDGDHTTGNGQCLVTANAASSISDVGDADVDNGKTTVLSPSFDLSKYTNPIIEYYRWYADGRGGGINADNDAWVVLIGNNTAGWQYVDSTLRSDYKWRKRIFAAKDYMTTLTDVQLKFVASDGIFDSSRMQGQSVTEAAVDDFFIYDKEPIGISKVTPEKATIFPNPADDRVYVSFKEGVSGELALYDISGRLLTKQELTPDYVRYSIDTKALSPGQYHVVISSADSIQNTSVIVTHK